MADIRLDKICCWPDGSSKRESKQAPTVKKPESAPTKLTFKEQRELNNIESEIEKAEAILTALHEQASSPAMISKPHDLAECYKRLAEQQAAVEKLYSTWQALEQKKREIDERTKVK